MSTTAVQDDVYTIGTQILAGYLYFTVLRNGVGIATSDGITTRLFRTRNSARKRISRERRAAAGTGNFHN